MMKTRNIYIGILFLALTNVSCQKEPVLEEKSDTIQLQIYAPDVSVTKSEIATIADLNEITLFAIHNNQDMFNALNNDPQKIPQVGVAINKPTKTQLWPLKYNNLANQEVTEVWGASTSDDTYQFHAYASHPSVPNPNIIVAEEGTLVTITQPSSLKFPNPQNLGDNVDYLLSYVVKYEIDDHANVNKPIVPIHLEHALTKVTVIADIKSSPKKLDVEFLGLKRKCELRCTGHKQVGSDLLQKNTWGRRYIGSKTATYTYSGTNEIPGEKKLMSFIAFPADNSTLKGYQLKITSTMEDNKTYEKTYTLSNTNDWISGHHVTYHITIDDQIRLNGSIEKWQEVDFIEGTILPIPKPQV